MNKELQIKILESDGCHHGSAINAIEKGTVITDSLEEMREIFPEEELSEDLINHTVYEGKDYYIVYAL